MELAKRISEDIQMKMQYGEFITDKQRERVYKVLNKHYKKTDIIEPWIVLELANNWLRPVKDILAEQEIKFLIKEWKKGE